MALLRGLSSAKVPGGTLKSLYPVSISKERGQGILRQIGILEKKPEPDFITHSVVAPTESKEPTTSKTSFLDKLKNIKLRKSSSADSSLSPKVSVAGKSNLKNKLESFFKL